MERAEGGGWGLAEPGTSVRPATVQRGLARGRQTRAGSRRSATKTIGPDYATPAGSSDANSGSASKASSGSGGARAGAGLGGSWGRPRGQVCVAAIFASMHLKDTYKFLRASIISLFPLGRIFQM